VKKKKLPILHENVAPGLLVLAHDLYISPGTTGTPMPGSPSVPAARRTKKAGTRRCAAYDEVLPLNGALVS